MNVRYCKNTPTPGLQYSYLIPGHCSTRDQRRIHGLNGAAQLRMILYADDIIILCYDIDELTEVFMTKHFPGSY